jgi:hypothetical protein
MTYESHGSFGMMTHRWSRTLTFLLLLCGTFIWGVIESYALLRARCGDAWQRSRSAILEGAK